LWLVEYHYLESNLESDAEMLNEILFDKYRIEEELHSAPTARYFSAVDVENDQVVIVMVVNAELIPPQEFLKRFVGVVKKLRELDSPNSVSVLDYGDYQNQAIVGGVQK